MQVGGWQVDASAIGVGVFVVESVGAGADDDAIDDVIFEVAIGEWGDQSFGLELFTNAKFVAFERDNDACRELDLVGVVAVGGDLGDGADAAFGGLSRDLGDDLGADRDDEVELRKGMSHD